MKLLDRYIASTVIQMTLLVIVVLLGMDFFIHLVEEFSDVGKGDFGLLQAVEQTFLALPSDLYRLFPMAGLIGCLLGLGSLAAHSELVVMRVSTLSVMQIARAVMLPVAMMVLLVTVLGEYVAPHLLHVADVQKSIAKSNGQAVATKQGIWLREGNNFIHINAAHRGGHLEGVTRYQFDDSKQLLSVSFAAMVDYQSNGWMATQVKQTTMGSEEISSETEEQQLWPIRLKPGVLKVSQIEPEEMSLGKLYSVMNYKKANNLDYSDYALPFWRRILQPLATCVMMLLAIPFIFGPLRTVTMGLRLLTGILVGFGFFLLNQFFAPFSVVYQIPPLLGALSPIVICAAAGTYLMRKTR